jgi:hypothetical protein
MCGSPAISVKTTAATSASKLNRNKGTSGLLTSQNSPNQPHDCMSPSATFGQEKIFLAASAESLYAFFLLFSNILWTLNMPAPATWRLMGWDGIILYFSSFHDRKHPYRRNDPAIQTLSISKVTYQLQKYTFNMWAWDKLLKLLSVLLLNCRLFARFSLPIEMTILHATRSGGFSDMKKGRDFEGRAPRLHETVGFGTSGSARTTQNHTFQTKSAGAFWKLDDPPRATRSNILLYWERVWPMQREILHDTDFLNFC